MCGLAGYLTFDGRNASEVIVHQMTNMIAHRGPDDEGQYINGCVGLGHRRLSIIDLSQAGHQPMMSSDGRYILTYNGEIYNFQELRAELEAKGHTFRSRTDSEVLLNGFRQWGPHVVDHLNGMFAFAIWDKVDKTLVVARDRYGIKPLYYYKTQQDFLFASEVKAFLPHPSFKMRVDKPALIEYFTFQNNFTDSTLFSGVKILPPGHWMTIKPSGEIVCHQYWDFNFQEESMTKGEAEEETDRLVRQAVSRQLVSDVPIGSYLSGGMDSGSITVLAAQEIPNLTSFTIGFDLNSASGMELKFDERAKAEYISYLAGTEHYEMVLKAGDMERCMSDLVWHLEEPRVGQCYPNFYACRLASKFCKVILAGVGGDEIFGGYPWRYYRSKDSENFDKYIQKYYQYWQRLIPNKDIWNIFGPIKDDVKDVWTEDIFRSVYPAVEKGDLQPADYVNLSLYMEAKTFLHGLLVVEDKLSMAHSLEARVPFLDNELVDFAQKIPVKYKLNNIETNIRLDENSGKRKRNEYFKKTNDGKLILRDVLSGIMPQGASGAVKQGFSAPDASWFKGESIDFVRDKLFSNNALIYDYMDKKSVQFLVTEHLTGKVNRRLLIWSLLYFEEWLACFISPSVTRRY